MSTIAWPAGVVPASADYGIEYDVQISVMRSGRVDTYGLPGARWTAVLSFKPAYDAARAPVEALIASLRGGARRLSMPYFGRRAPNGTLRGSPILSSPTTVGANVIALTNCNGGVKAGDILGLGTQLLMVEEDADPSGGDMTIKISPCVRTVYSAATAVVWDAPTCLWIPRSSVAGPFPYLPGPRPSFSIELVEAG